MLKFPCLVLDHDDTVVQSEATVNYPCFCQTLEAIRPGEKITLREYTEGCFYQGFMEMCRSRYQFTDEELLAEFEDWKRYAASHIPPAFPGIDRIIRRQKEAGGLVCVVSHSGFEIIARDYQNHFAVLPDAVYGCDLPVEQRKPSTYALEDIMRRFSLSPSEILVVDDLKPGCEMARSAGIAVAYAGWSGRNIPELDQELEAYSDFSFYSTKDLEKFLFD